MRFLQRSEINLLQFLHEHVLALSNSKVFVGLVIICLNTASKFVNVKLSRTTENYLKTSFAWQILIFCMSFMATRDIYVALFLTFVFVMLTQYICNEESAFCMLPDSFKERYTSLAESGDAAGGPTLPSGPPTQAEVKAALDTLRRATENPAAFGSSSTAAFGSGSSSSSSSNNNI